MSTDRSPLDLQAENDSLRARVAALEEEARALREARDRALRVADLAPVLIYLYDLVEQRNVYANRQLAEGLGYSAEEILRMGDAVLPMIMHPDDLATMPAHIGRLFASADGEVLEVAYRCRRPDGEWRWYLSRDTCFSRDPNGKPQVFLGVVDDITAQRRAEEEVRHQAEELERRAEALLHRDRERVKLQEQVITAQAEALRELSTPLVPIADGVIAMPLVGAIDVVRSQQILEALLSGISARQAQVAIVDITGVREADAQVADGLLRAARAAGLLGAEVVLTGIAPAVAQALTEIGADLGRTVTRGTFQAGIAYALGRTGRRSASGGRSAR